MGSEPDRQHSAETEKSVLGEESVGPSESGSTPLDFFDLPSSPSLESTLCSHHNSNLI